MSRFSAYETKLLFMKGCENTFPNVAEYVERYAKAVVTSLCIQALGCTRASVTIFELPRKIFTQSLMSSM